jgi:hypothetical protein
MIKDEDEYGDEHKNSLSKSVANVDRNACLTLYSRDQTDMNDSAIKWDELLSRREMWLKIAVMY